MSKSQFDFKEGLDAGEIRILDTIAQNVGIPDFDAQNGRASFDQLRSITSDEAHDRWVPLLSITFDDNSDR